VTDHAHRGLIDESAWRCLPPDPIDFMTVNDSNRRDCRSADRLQFNTLRDQRTGDENRPLFNLLLPFGGLVSAGIGERCSDKYAGRYQNYSALPYRPRHKQNYTREVTVCKLSKR
jgi:hypothetical protein